MSVELPDLYYAEVNGNMEYAIFLTEKLWKLGYVVYWLREK